MKQPFTNCPASAQSLLGRFAPDHPTCDVALQQQGIPFTYMSGPTTSKAAGAVGGNSLLLDGSVNWKNINRMTNYWAAPGGGYFNAW